jgi:hypothetical protein
LAAAAALFEDPALSEDPAFSEDEDLLSVLLLAGADPLDDSDEDDDESVDDPDDESDALDFSPPDEPFVAPARLSVR